MNIRLLVADDHDVVLAGIRLSLRDTEFEIVGEARSGPQLVELVGSLQPDLVLTDVMMPQGGGLEALEQLKSTAPGVGIVVYTGLENSRLPALASSLGAAALVTKGASRDELLTALRNAMTRKPSRSRRLPQVAGTTPAEPYQEVALTEREKEVLVFLAQGLTNKQIANELTISYETVKEHVQHILQKVGVTDRTQAAVWAVRRGLV